MLSIGLWLKLHRPDIPQADGVSPGWAGAFLATSAFANNGMSLIDASMAPFQLEYVFPFMWLILNDTND
jgi:Trk-type K+ transport system membrane component